MMHFFQRIIYRICLVCMFVPGVAVSQTPEQIHAIDSLVSALYSTSDEYKRVELLYHITNSHYSVDSTRHYASMLLQLASRLHYAKYESSAFGYLAWVEFCNNNYVQSSLYAQQGLVISDSIGDQKLSSIHNYYLGNSYGLLNDFNMAIVHYSKAYDYLRESGDYSVMCDVLRNMSNVEYINMLFDDARAHVDSAIASDVRRDDVDGLAQDYYILGEINYSRYSERMYASPQPQFLDSAKFYLDKALAYSVKAGDDYVYIHVSACKAVLLLDEVRVEADPRRRVQMLDSCKAIIDKSVSLATSLGYDIELKTFNNVRCGHLVLSRQFDKGKALLDSVMSVYSASPDDYKEDIVYLYLCYSDYYRALGDHDKAMHFAHLHHENKFNNRQTDFVANAARSLAQGDFNMKLREHEIRYENEARERRLVTMAVSIGLLLVLVIAVVVIVSYLRSRRANRILDLKNTELEQQKEEILTQNERLEEQRNLLAAANGQITDSLNYASLIQGAAMPSDDYLNDLFADHFVIFRPKDIVSGDFYWASRTGHLTMFAVADCTGHGVPGAFVSMLGISILNDLVPKDSSSRVSAGQLLDDLRDNLMKALHQGRDSGDSRDGMDIALVVFDESNGSVHYAGAYRPLYIYHEGNLTKINADRMPIGAYTSDVCPFTDHVVDVVSGDMIYLFSDGIVDQFGFDDQKGREAKFTARRLNSLLESVGNLPCSEQRVAVESAMDDWRRVGTDIATEQTDDNLLVGIRIR